MAGGPGFGLTMSSVPVVMAYGAAPDAPVYMTHAGMMERVRYLERWSRQRKNLCDDRHKWTVDRVKWMVDRVNYLTGKMEALSRNIDKYLDHHRRFRCYHGHHAVGWTEAGRT